ncbi:uncharacterized protein EV154DRAFT_98695 [Mucor mucedo]|uniref:uncharacterized protein n=1 Tax=Mucor mucedo TaxID=29922 RepID=UPI00221FBFBE|nr:uncharacterized protein EV154DRAFT_98695 [Mucor mucedo]KAI7894322.1 hypothetical protein EV154DRAFT_98695 [Mucor mucedo]
MKFVLYSIHLFFLLVALQWYIICTLIWIHSIIRCPANGRVSTTRCLFIKNICHEVAFIFQFLNTISSVHIFLLLLIKSRYLHRAQLKN